jgi:hypothetical protein
MWSEEVRARLLTAKRIGQTSKVAVEVMDLTEALEEIEQLRGLLAEWIPRHSAACCTPYWSMPRRSVGLTPGIGTFPPGPLLPKWCCCDDLSKRSRAALAPAEPPREDER